MFKLLLSSAIFTPCIIAPLFFSAASDVPVFETNNVQTAYIEPELDKLERCQDAELDVFFHDEYVTLHSAEYLADSIEIAKTCGNARYIVTPIDPKSVGISTRIDESVYTEEVSLLLKAHGVDVEHSSALTHTEFNGLSANGRLAKLKISFDDQDNA